MKELNIQIEDKNLFKKIKRDLKKFKGIKIREKKSENKLELIGFGMWSNRDDLGEDWIRRLRKHRYE